MNKVKASEINLTTNEALVLQQVYEDGGDDAATLAAQMGMPRRTAMHVLADLRQLVQRIWPEAQAIVY
ncbi:hypothetical protein FBF29_04490 [Candidatus Saccharibacteria bacterium oral taxon 488]|nr:hypothetical protein FBF29_04490 [Candidatus Saccharibacteria bacterium oral taxon 488]